MEKISLHEPVMVDEAIGFLNLKNGDKVLDATVGCGGHAKFILEKIRPDGFLIGIDCDKASLEIAERQLNGYNGIYRLIHANFTDLDNVLPDLGIEKIDAALFDLGISSYQIEDKSRGFSFEGDGFLDMRMDPSRGLRAYDIVNRFNKGGPREDYPRFRRGKILEENHGFHSGKKKENPYKFCAGPVGAY